MGLLRKIMIETRNHTKNREAKSAAIRERLFSFMSDKVKHCFIFVNFGSEVNTTEIIQELLKRGIHVYCPKVFDHHEMEFFEIRSLDELSASDSRYSIPEPVLPEGMSKKEAAAKLACYPEETEEYIMIVPGVAFDEHGGRVGYGSGFYDNYLSAHPVLKVALAFECQIWSRLSLKESDVRMDALITEKRLLEWKQDA